MSFAERRRALMALAGKPKFVVTYNGAAYEYEFDKGMTWAQFIASPYNDGSFIANGSTVCYKAKNIEVRLNQTTALVSNLISEENYSTFVWATTKKYIYQLGKTSLSYGSISGTDKGYSFSSSRGIQMSCIGTTKPSYTPIQVFISNIDVSSYKQLVVDCKVGEVNSYTGYYFNVSGGSNLYMTNAEIRKTLYYNIANLYGNKTIFFYCDNYNEYGHSISNTGITISNLYLSP